ncbi:MAG: Hsp70 family protein [Pikeienuella sp.]
MTSDILAIDFGTSNSAAAIIENNRPRRLTIEGGEDTLPTAVFFPTKKPGMQIGMAAASALITGQDGRYLRALKSVLGNPLLHESRMLGGKRRPLADIVSAFLAEVKQRAEQLTGQQYNRALSGRPVRFHSADATRDAKAEDDLRACYLAAGFKDVAFMYEPEAAALANHTSEDDGQLGLIVDIGGGTSDFSVFRSEQGKLSILASHGIRLGGTNFDQAISVSHVMPHLGMGGELRREFGRGLQPIPKAIFTDLATWAKIPFLYNHETRRMVAEMVKLAVTPTQLERLETVLEIELGHQLAFAVERGKIAANSGETDAQIDMSLIEQGLSAAIDETSLNEALLRYRSDLKCAAEETLKLAGVELTAINSVVLVGGSSLMRMITSEMAALCPEAQLKQAEAFTAVVDGLALATPSAF